MLDQYFFKNKSEFLNFLLNSLHAPTAFKIQKSAYFLWAFYAATYGNFAASSPFPRELFKPTFEAKKYGPVDTELLTISRTNQLSNSNPAEYFETVEAREVEQFLNDIIEQINREFDIALIFRACEDRAYQEAVHQGAGAKMDPQKIKADYLEYVSEQDVSDR